MSHFMIEIRCLTPALKYLIAKYHRASFNNPFPLHVWHRCIFFADSCLIANGDHSLSVNLIISKTNVFFLHVNPWTFSGSSHCITPYIQQKYQKNSIFANYHSLNWLICSYQKITSTFFNMNRCKDDAVIMQK